MSGYRLATADGRSSGAPVSFTFDGRAVAGRAGESVAAALIAAGERVVARSFKYHRPRGIYGFDLDEPSALVACGDEIATLATRLTVREGMAVRAVNAWPSARFDLRAVNDLFGRLLPAGFYYKTFMGPAGAWPRYERVIRAAAGLGRVRGTTPSWRRETRHAHCDVLVVGAGPAGLAAAHRLASSGLRVLLADDGEAPGRASLEAMDARVGGERAIDWAERLTAEFDAAPETRRLARTLVTGLYDHGFAVAVERDPCEGLDERLWRIRAERIVLATGAIERPLVFANNDRPGVMSLNAVRRYAERNAVACGRSVVVFANNGGAYGDAARLRGLGVEVTAIVDPRPRIDAAAVELVSRLGIAVLGGQSVVDVVGRQVEGVRVAGRDAAEAARTVDGDVLAVSGGWTPLVHLHGHAGGRVAYDDAVAAFLPVADDRGVRSAGACAGRFSLAAAIADGAAAAAESTRDLGRPVAPWRAADVVTTDELALDLEPYFESPRPREAGKAFVDLAADTTAADIRLAVQEGYESVELMKRYTTTGMALDQGRHGNLNAVALLAAARDERPGTVGVTTFRPPFAPVAFGTLAPREGWFLTPARATPLTSWHEAAGAVMYDVGGHWRRPGYYPRAGEGLAEATARECRACRGGAAMYDSSPLGKFEFAGRDVVAFLERMYCNRWADLGVGNGRYGVMLHEDGRLFDDGVAFRLGAERFLVTTTTGNAEAALARFEYHRQVVWPGLDVRLVPVTTQWADIVVCGPRARDVLAAAGTTVDLDRAAFPFMAIREGAVAGVPARVMRVSFTGELSFEVNVPARRALEVWNALLAAGAAHDMQPLGSEANHVLRVEKGFISVGHEADGVADPFDLGMKWIVAMDKPDFVGKRSLQRNLADTAPRAQLVGLLSHDPGQVPAEGSQVLDETGARGRGYVTASCMSPALGRSIALALIEDGRALTDASVRLFGPSGETSEARVTRPVFLDPKGERMRS
ncbi:MAG: (2Fe-2S)-binding protein [Alphaproteobacteria bacterium]|nr:(2Fe-2S)-binding protein [Alphaproteobacteria bacterium]